MSWWYAGASLFFYNHVNINELPDWAKNKNVCQVLVVR